MCAIKNSKHKLAKNFLDRSKQSTVDSFVSFDVFKLGLNLKTIETIIGNLESFVRKIAHYYFATKPFIYELCSLLAILQEFRQLGQARVSQCVLQKIPNRRFKKYLHSLCKEQHALSNPCRQTVKWPILPNFLN